MSDTIISIDLRSDTVTKPSSEMWDKIRNMSNSELGDDVEGEDPTINKLEEKSAHLLGKEAAIFVTSGTQGNLLALLAQTNPGDEILLETHSHIYKWEVGGAARIGGLMVKTFPSNKAIFNPEDLAPLIRDRNDIHQPQTTLICLENTHNYHGGIILPISLFKQTFEFAQKYDLKIHLDGARLWNAIVKQNIDIKEYTKYVDTVQVCLSKGLACPIGSILAGSNETITRARKFRKMLGGGWRQAGIVAQFGLVALNDRWISRLAEDHSLALDLAQNLRDEQLDIHVPEPDTNIVMVHLPSHIKPEKFEQLMYDQGILAHTMGNRIRLVTHFGLSSSEITYAASKIKELVQLYNSINA